MIRDASPFDFAPIREFLDRYLRRDYFVRDGQLLAVLGGRYHRCVVAEDPPVILGVGIISRARRQLINLLVCPDWRGQGLGTAIFERLSPRLIRVKYNMSTGSPALFYDRLGFEPVVEEDGPAHLRTWISKVSQFES